MASILINRACPQCGGIAIDEDYYKIGERYIYCYCCGYHYIREQLYYDNKENRVHYKEEECLGFGIFRLINKNGTSTIYPLESPITDELIAVYKGKLENNEVNREKCYLISYCDGVFTTLFGDVPEKYRIHYEEYKKKGYPDIVNL
ncbi:hypothetical protein ABE288_07220 [Bacillus salipaludis]|uniref:hypothetical protein n=1 Tax=Bacillus salipaludis TaxID=2547811 RepID=UPI003D1B4135